MRVAASGIPDAIELRRSGQQWFTEARQPVEFDFLMSDARAVQRISPARPAKVSGAAAAAIH
jgi:hypothetical protein